MAEITVTLKKLLDDHVAPIAARFGATGAYNAFIAVLSVNPAVLNTKIDIPIPNLGGAADAVSSVANALSPIDPADVLKGIAKAVGDAEKALNGQNLAVLSGKVNVQLLVNIGGAAGAQANFDLAIGPVPQG